MTCLWYDTYNITIVSFHMTTAYMIWCWCYYIYIVTIFPLVTALTCHHHHGHRHMDLQARGPSGTPNFQVIALRAIRHIQLFKNYSDIKSFLLNFAQTSYDTEFLCSACAYFSAIIWFFQHFITPNLNHLCWSCKPCHITLIRVDIAVK